MAWVAEGTAGIPEEGAGLKAKDTRGLGGPGQQVPQCPHHLGRRALMWGAVPGLWVSRPPAEGTLLVPPQPPL